MTIQLTPPQATVTLEALRNKLSNMEGLFKRLNRFNSDSLRLPVISLELTNLKLAISAFEMTMKED